MIFKESGYDEYLAEKIKKGLEDSQAGRTSSLEQANAEWQAVLEEIAQECREFEQEIAYV